MGQIAEDILDGSMCDICNCYFEHPSGGIYVHDHPATCEDCWRELDDSEKQEHTKCDDNIITF